MREQIQLLKTKDSEIELLKRNLKSTKLQETEVSL
jgi:hypothetical protein